MHSVHGIVFALLGKAMLLGIIGGGLLGAAVGLPFLIFGAFPGALIGGAIGLMQGVVNGLLAGLISRLCFYPLSRPLLYQFVLLVVCVPIGFFGTHAVFSPLVGPMQSWFGNLVAAIAACYAIYASHRIAKHYRDLVGVNISRPRLTLPYNPYDHAFLRQLFDAMHGSYKAVSWVCSFGFSERWRRQLVAGMDLRTGMRVGDLMSGAGDMWPHLLPRIGAPGSIAAIDFSPQIAATARARTSQYPHIQFLEEDSLYSSLPSGSLDAIVCCYGVKTLAAHEQALFAQETSRLLRDHGLLGIIEISNPHHALLGWPYRAYLRHVVPLVGRLFLADPLSYRMLARYTEAFGNCHELEQIFTAHGFEVHYFELFGGCASGLVGMKVAAP